MPVDLYTKQSRETLNERGLRVSGYVCRISSDPHSKLVQFHILTIPRPFHPLRHSPIDGKRFFAAFVHDVGHDRIAIIETCKTIARLRYPIPEPILQKLQQCFGLFFDRFATCDKREKESRERPSQLSSRIMQRLQIDHDVPTRDVLGPIAAPKKDPANKPATCLTASAASLAIKIVARTLIRPETHPRSFCHQLFFWACR